MSVSWRVTVLRGGPSAEREVSLASGAAVADACRRLGCEVTEADITPDNLSALEIAADVVFPVLHGEFGEDGQLQEILQTRGMPFVGCDSAASRLAIDKDASKRRWRDVGLPTAPWICIDQETEITAVDYPGPPAVLKPLCEGSSIGTVLCGTLNELHTQAREAISKYDKVLVEQKLTGPELTVGILEDRALPVIEIKPTLGFYDFEAKYERNDTEYLFEPGIDAETYSVVQEMAVGAFQALGCRDYGRVDFIVDRQDGVQLLEINTIPGFTDHSLLPKAAEKVGIGFDELVAQLLGLAHRRKTPL